MQDHTLRSLSQRHLHVPAIAQQAAEGLMGAERVQSLRSLWERSPEPRSRAYAGLIPEDRFKAFLFRRALREMTDDTARRFLTTSGDHLTGAACWRPLPWDSEQTGLAAARLILLLAAGEYKEALHTKVALLGDLLQDCRAQGVQYLIARVDCSDLSSIHALETAGFELIDGIQTSALFLKGPCPSVGASGFDVRAFKPGDLEDVLSIARGSYVYDRFHADCAISPERADAANADWLRNSCTGMADHVVVAADANGVVAYVTCKLDWESRAETGVSVGTIEMVATARRARGQGAAAAATQAAIQWFAAQGVQIVEVGTQLANIAAARLYQKCEFLPVATTLTFRTLINGDRA